MLQKAWLECSEIKMPHRLAESIDHRCACSFLPHNNLSMHANDKSWDESLDISQVAGLVVLVLHVPVILMLLLYISLTAR